MEVSESRKNGSFGKSSKFPGIPARNFKISRTVDSQFPGALHAFDVSLNDFTYLHKKPLQCLFDITTSGLLSFLRMEGE